MSQQIFGKLNTKKKIIILVLLGILGILLVILGSGGIKTEKNNENIVYTSATEEYISLLENKIRNITEQISGSEKVSVVISVDGGIEYIYVTNDKQQGDISEREYVTVKGKDGSYQLAVLREVYPEILGVTVVCPGGDGAGVKFKLINAISTALGVPSNRICVTGTK